MRARTSSMFITRRLPAAWLRVLLSSEDRTKRLRGKQPRPKVLDFPHGHQKENQKSSQEKARESREESTEEKREETCREKTGGQEGCRCEEALRDKIAGEAARQAIGKTTQRQSCHEK